MPLDNADPAETVAETLASRLAGANGPYSTEYSIVVLGMAIGKLLRRLSPTKRREMILIVSHEMAKARRGW